MNNIIKSVIETSKYVFERKLVSGKAGNVSARFKNEDMDVIAITPTLKSLNRLNESDIVLVDINGKNLTKGKPSSEVFMHLAIYKSRNDVDGIVHTHSPYATGFSFSNEKIKRLEGFGAIKTEYLPELKYEKPGSSDLAHGAAEKLGQEDVLVLKNHGIIAIGETVHEAGDLAEFVEEIAKTQYITKILNK
ncbi:class II aldolase/adducin family protein [Methanobrevibacter filiformis]|uniref:L-fuculose phosphate aldolase n=1 Tax=Methanobrevibacter filiformis TaxID=55758 RepID=A0A166FET4_9EURY|nr:class II aldolase/adducin family protein [Methanobrevibacter filiformis]KZX17603.1 L-fuculose phosphate aldolase [Methanobrevibacter filiformis]